MPRIDVRCANGHEHEVLRPIADWPKTPPCPDCGSETEQMMLPPSSRSNADPVIVFQAPDGTFRFPGDPNGLSVKKYEQSGFTRVELRGAADVRRFESQMNKREYSLAMRRVERKQELSEQRESHTRSELRHLMGSMTPFGRALAREAMRRNDNKPREKARDLGFHVDVFSNNRSNRDESRDSSGRRRRD